MSLARGEVALERTADAASRSVQYHPLIGLGDPQNVTRFFSRPTFNVPQRDHLALRGREASDLQSDQVERLAGEHLILRRAPPGLRRRRPVMRPLRIGCP